MLRQGGRAAIVSELGVANGAVVGVAVTLRSPLPGAAVQLRSALPSLLSRNLDCFPDVSSNDPFLGVPSARHGREHNAASQEFAFGLDAVDLLSPAK